MKLGKDPYNDLEKIGVVFKFSCLKCSKSSVGQTGTYRPLSIRYDKNNINL